MTSEFWVDLADAHAAALDDHGFDRVKRVQALRYFTWQWSPGRLRGSHQARYLIRHVPLATIVRAAVGRAELTGPAWAPVEWGWLERWTYVLAARLIWEVAASQGSARVLALPEPQLGSPFPVHWRGRLISQDLANTALEVETMLEALAGRQPAHILEVGAGYGRTAHALLSLFPGAAYTVVDIPPALEISRWYLTNLFPDRDLTFVDARVADPVAPFDLAVTISSLAEMTNDDIARYLALFERLASPGAVVYLKQWARWMNPVDGIEFVFDDHVPAGGALVVRRRAPVQTAFLEAAWRMPGGPPLEPRADVQRESAAPTRSEEE